MKNSLYTGVLIQSLDDFGSVRDGRRAMPFYFDVDLSVARSGAGSAIFNIAGNSFYIDANPTDGVAFVEFQDTANDAAPAPLYVSPGTIFNVPFTQIRLQNSAQAGKKIRIVYGVDIDFQPGSISQVAFTGAVNARPEAPTGVYGSSSALGANGNDPVFLAAANTAGAILYTAYSSQITATVGTDAFVAKATAPASVIDGHVVAASLFQTTIAPNSGCGCQLMDAQYIPAGLGLYYITQLAASPIRSARYKLL